MTDRPVTMEVRPSAPLRGEARVPGDKSISHRTAMLAALAQGPSRIRGFLQAGDCLHTLQALQALGARCHVAMDGDVLVEGTGGQFTQPAGVLDMGNSGTGLRLLAGLLAGQEQLDVLLTGDESLRARPMRRIQDPLEKMGARVDLTGDRGTAPVRVRGARLHGIEYRPPMASAQVKSCVLLAGLFAEGTTTVVEPAPTRDHTERLLLALDVPLRIAGNTLVLDGFGPAGPRWPGRTWQVPADFSSAAFFLAGAAARPGADVLLRGVGINPRRATLVDVLRRMGADITVSPGTATRGEAVADLRVRGRPLRGTVVQGAEIPGLIDEIPVLAAVAALAEGETEIRDAAELRHKESDRIAVMARNLQAAGVAAADRPDGLVVRGPAPLDQAAVIHSHGDHRIAMALAILGTAAREPFLIQDVACVSTSYPAFWSDLKGLGAYVEQQAK